MSCTDILASCDCKKCISISICICSCRSIVSSVSAPIKIFVCFKKKNRTCIAEVTGANPVEALIFF